MKRIILMGVVIWTWLALYASGEDITLVVSQATTVQDYAYFLTSVGNKVKATAKTCHCLPMASGPNPNPTFLEVKIKSASTGNIVKLAFQRSDMYLEGYADLYNGKCRYRTFSDSVDDVKSFLCGNVEQPGGDVNKVYYKKDYASIENKAKTVREQFDLGMEILRSKLDKIYGKTKNDKLSFDYVKAEAEFFLLTIQMIAEATRFKYIEDKIKDNIDNVYRPDTRAISLENNWSKVSEKIAAQTDPNVSFKMPDGMKDKDGNAWQRDTVSNLKENYISLLQYVSNCKVKSLTFYVFNYINPSSMIAMSDFDTK